MPSLLQATLLTRSLSHTALFRSRMQRASQQDGAESLECVAANQPEWYEVRLRLGFAYGAAGALFLTRTCTGSASG